MNERLNELLQNKWVVPTGVGVIAFGGGIALGMVIERKFSHKFQVTIDKVVVTKIEDDPVDIDEEEDVKAVIVPDPSDILPRPNPADITVDEERKARIEELAEAGIPLDKVYSQVKEEFDSEETPEDLDEDDEEEDSFVVNVFAGSNDEWDYDEELANRSSDAPYVLHKDEFYVNEFEFVQETLTYYAGDDIMVDTNDVPVYNYASYVGELKFGHGSQDPGVVFVRNEKNKCDYEILLDRGHYSVEVLGLDDSKEEIKHSSPRRFRMDE